MYNWPDDEVYTKQRLAARIQTDRKECVLCDWKYWCTFLN